jgi:hypothetical protein
MSPRCAVQADTKNKALVLYSLEELAHPVVEHQHKLRNSPTTSRGQARGNA